jgi:lysyl endopeptidase
MQISSIASRLTFLAFILCCAAQIIFAQTSATNYTAPPETAVKAQPSLAAQTRAGQAPLSRTQTFSAASNLRTVRLNELSQAEQERTNDKKNFRIGIARPLPRQIESLNEFTTQTTNDGTLYLLRIISPAAKSLRLHFKALSLPDGSRLFVYSRQNNQIFSPPYSGTRANFWTPSLPGEEIVIECFVPAKAKAESSAAPFQIDAVNHIFRAPRESQSARPQVEDAGACNQDVPAEFSEAARATALIAFAKPDGEYVCSGTLMADIKKTGTPYFLTANHCISNGVEASSAELYWFYDTGSEPTSAPTRGAGLLVTDQADDYTLLQLSTKPPSGAVYSGWTSIPQAIGTSVTGIHHPQADHKRAAFGKIVEASCPAEIAPEFCDFYAKVRWDRGITEPGSSGSGIFIGTGNQTQLVGLLSGGESSCENPTSVDFYGRLARMFGAFGYYLTNNEICRYTLLQDKFSYGANGGNGEFTIVPKIGGESCPWQARSNVNWITITSGASGTALGKVAFQVAANTSDKPRAGAITIAGRNVLILQAPTIAPTSPCAATKIEFGQTVTGDLRAAECSSVVDGSLPALRYAFEAEEGQSFAVSFRRYAQNSRMHLIHPDGRVVQFRDSYSAYAPSAGTYVIELALLTSESSIPATFEFLLVKGCKYKFSANYFEVDGFGASLTPPSGFARMYVESTGENCLSLITTPDESGIDGLHAPYSAPEKAVILAAGAAIDPKQRYIVLRILDQPIIVKQIPRCSSATTFSYTPSELNLPNAGGTFQMEVKRTAGPSCSWEIRPHSVYDNGHSETRDVLIQPENYSNWARGTNEGTVTYTVPTNTYFRNKQYVLKNGSQVAQTITQPFVGANCARPTLQVGQSADAVLTTTDCNWYEMGQYVDVYQLNVVEGEQYAVEISGTAGSEISAELGIAEYGSNGVFADLRQKASCRAPETGFGTAYTPGTYLLRVFGKPASYQIKLLGVGPTGCVYKINKEGEILVPADTTNFSVQLDCNRGDCDWTTKSSASWITFPQGGSGKGSQTISLMLAPNTGAKRQATITIGGRTFSLVQDYSCSYRKYSTAAPNKFFGSYQGGSYRYWVETSATCPTPTITPNADWIQAVSPQPYQVIVNVAPNPGGFRKGTVTIAGDVFEVIQGGNDLVVTTAADYQRTVAPGSLLTVFNQGLSVFSEAAQSLPLPTWLANSSVLIEQPDGRDLQVPLLYVSPTQINFFLPESFVPGRTRIQVISGGLYLGGFNLYASGEFEIAAIAPNIFTADSTGKGPAAADIQRIRPGQAVVYERTYTTITDEQGKPMIVARPITIGTGDEKTYLVLYATGVRKRNANAAVTAQIGEVTVPVEYAGAQGEFVGLDQINILLPPSLRGKGLVNVSITMDGKTTNSVQINIAP